MVFRATLVAALPILLFQPATVLAQAAVWQNGQPVFQSDRQAAARAAEARKDRIHQYPAIMTGGGRPAIKPKAPDMVSFPNDYGHGTVVIDTKERTLYYTVSTTTAFQYPISVGRRGFKWYGSKKVSRVQSWPSWTPPPQMRARQPYLPITMKGGIRNPLGATAIYLGASLYRIHGTNNPKSIGRAASSGCFRMMNKHVLHLAKLVEIGTPVHVMRSWKGEVSELKELGETNKQS
jgi:lipoprotein-anchoring transpeptidase ErfK/SrfK